MYEPENSELRDSKCTDENLELWEEEVVCGLLKVLDGKFGSLMSSFRRAGINQVGMQTILPERTNSRRSY